MNPQEAKTALLRQMDRSAVASTIEDLFLPVVGASGSTLGATLFAFGERGLGAATLALGLVAAAEGTRETIKRRRQEGKVIFQDGYDQAGYERFDIQAQQIEHDITVLSAPAMRRPSSGASSGAGLG